MNNLTITGHSDSWGCWVCERSWNQAVWKSFAINTHLENDEEKAGTELCQVLFWNKTGIVLWSDETKIELFGHE